MNKKRKLLITIVATIVIAFSAINLTGCTPSGYFANNGGTRPYIYVGKGNTYLLGNVSMQFSDINSSEIFANTGGYHFYFDNTRHFILFEHEHPIYALNPVVSVFADENKIGKLRQIPTDWDWPRYVTLSRIFLHENYLYYHLSWHRSVFHLFQHSFSHSVSRWTYYRFNLKTGSNEQIELEIFVETLQIYNPNIKINPNWRG